MVLLLTFSGNPVASFMEKYALLIICSGIFLLYFKKIKRDFYIPFLIIACALLLLYTCQLITLYFVSWLAGFRYIVTILFGGLVYYLLGERFSFKFFIVMYYICAISLVGYVVVNLLHIRPHGITFPKERVSISYIIYTYKELHAYRNCGMFWEPGAFAGILVLCIGLNVKDFTFLWRKHKLKVFVIIAALLTTQSTTGYIAFFITVIYYFTFYLKNPIVKVAIVPVLCLASILIYTNADFLQQKVKKQTEQSQSLAKDEFSNSRFGSFIFDSYYIKKHPIVGNGFSQITRYADHPYLIGLSLGNGNGFSNYMACLGIPFMFFYLLLSFNALKKSDIRMAFLLVFIILLTLFGEQWLQYPLYTGIMFFNTKRKFI